MSPIVTAGIVLAVALASFLGYLLANTGILKKAEALAQKVANAEDWLTKKLTPYIGQKTAAEVEKLVEDTIAAEVGKIVHLPAAQIIVIANSIIHALFPEPQPAPAPTPAPAK